MSTINKNIISSNNCKIKVQSNSDTNIFDVSDGLFQIKGSVEAFNIITPNGGDLIYNGTSSFIYWEDIINQKVSNVDISFSSDNGKNWNVIANNLQNNGVYSWVVPSDIKSNKCLIKISSSLDSKLDSGRIVIESFTALLVCWPSLTVTEHSTTSSKLNLPEKFGPGTQPSTPDTSPFTNHVIFTTNVSPSAS